MGGDRGIQKYPKPKTQTKNPILHPKIRVSEPKNWKNSVQVPEPVIFSDIWFRYGSAILQIRLHENPTYIYIFFIFNFVKQRAVLVCCAIGLFGRIGLAVACDFASNSLSLSLEASGPSTKNSVSQSHYSDNSQAMKQRRNPNLTFHFCSVLSSSPLHGFTSLTSHQSLASTAGWSSTTTSRLAARPHSSLSASVRRPLSSLICISKSQLSLTLSLSSCRPLTDD